MIWKIIWYWEVLEEIAPHVYPSWKKRRKFLCRCKCWIEKWVNINILRNWDSKSCGCYQKNNPSWVTHWLSNSHLYKIFYWIKSRCNNTKDTWYINYWWRGIKCKWNSFEEFYQDMKDTYKEWLTIDRINNEWNYCKENCRWADRAEQSRNRRNSIIYNWKCLSEWSIELWIPYNTLLSRYTRYWWSIERTLEIL